MTTVTSQTTFTLVDTEELSEIAPLILLPENTGMNVLRELHYPGDLLPKLIYDQNPDKYENFDSHPLTARPIVQTDQTIGGNVTSRWLGFIGDNPVREIWTGNLAWSSSNQTSNMFTYFLRRLWEYYVNPPLTGYITWWPKDRTVTGFNIEIENLTVDGAAISLDYLATRGGMTVGDVILTFRIVSEVV